jgi:hypothetical protein
MNSQLTLDGLDGAPVPFTLLCWRLRLNGGRAGADGGTSRP